MCSLILEQTCTATIHSTVWRPRPYEVNYISKTSESDRELPVFERMKERKKEMFLHSVWREKLRRQIIRYIKESSYLKQSGNTVITKAVLNARPDSLASVNH